MSDPAILADQANDPTFSDIWEELVWRGLVHVSTDESELQELLAGDPITFYCGFDPTAPSLHLGNLVQLLVMRRLQLAGHRPLGLVGGSTGLIGDPRPTAERTLNTRETVTEWVGYLQGQVSRFLSAEGDNGMRLVNNLDWTAPLSAIDFLREIGKHYRVGTMIKKDAVAARLNSDAGISYTEFSYQILQGLDYLELYRSYGCVLQTGGSDQWGNLTSGTDLIHRTEGVSVHAIGTPLITNSDGTKFGKSEGNAIWLDSALVSPYAFYQFWLNTDDADVISRLKVFTFLDRARDRASRGARGERAVPPRVPAHARARGHDPRARRRRHRQGDRRRRRALRTGRRGRTRRRDARERARVSCRTPRRRPTATIVQLLLDTGLSGSISEARRAIAQGGVSVNGVKVTDDTATIAGSTLPSGMAVLRRGKKTLAGIFVV